MTGVYLAERLTFDKLFRYSEPKRVKRSLTVSGPPLEIDSYQDSAYYAFNFKSKPSTTGLRHRGYIKFFKPRSGTQKPLQHVDCQVDCTCLGPDTLILFEDGTYRPIKDVKVGDRVITHTGTAQEVTNVAPREVQPHENVYNLAIEGFPGKLIVTGNHPFLTLRGNEKCLCGCGKALTENASRAKNRTSSPGTIISRKFKQGHHIRGQAIDHEAYGHFEWTPVDDFRHQEWFLTPWQHEGNLSINQDFARLLGYYVAEGCLPNKRGRAVRLTFNCNEWDTLALDVLNICQRLGFECRRVRRSFKKQRWLDVTVYSKFFKRFCAEHVGVGSKTKRLSETIMRWDNSALRELFVGSILGDGWLDPARGCKYLSSNFYLASQLSTVLNRLRIRNTLSMHSIKGQMFQVLVPRGPSAEIVRSWLSPYLREKDRFKVSQERLHGIEKDRSQGQLRALQSIEKINYSGLVYDLTVAVDESFVAHGIAVHNCPDYRYRFAWVNKQKGSSRVGPNSLNQAWNKAPRHTNPAGIPGLCVAEGELVSTRRGLIPIQDVHVEDFVWTLDGWRSVTAAMHTGKKPVLEITLHSGRVLKVTPEHRVLAFAEATGCAWVEAQNLQEEGHRLCITFSDADDVILDSVKSIRPGSVVNVYDLTVEGAHHFTANGVVVHNCKHLLATREYIYGLLSSFPSNAPDTAEKLNKLTKFATKRWTNFDAQMQAAKEKEAKLRGAREMRRRGEMPPTLPQSFATGVTSPAQRGRSLPPPLPAPEEEPEDTVRAPALPKAGKPGGSNKYAALAKRSGFPSAAAMKSAKTIGDSINAENQNSKLQRVDILATETMNTLDQSVKIIEDLEMRQRRSIREMFDEESDYGAAPDAPEADTMDQDGETDALPPSEPPVSDTAVGADTEGQVVLGLLGDIKDLLGQLVAVQAPGAEEEPGEGDEPLEDEDGALDAAPEEDADEEAEESDRPGASHLST